MKEYDTRAILNYVSGKKSADAINGAKDCPKENTLKKPTVFKSLVVCAFFTVPNCVQWGDVTVRILFGIQLLVLILWFLLSKYWLKLVLSEEIPTDSNYKLLSSLALFLIFELMIVGGFRVIDSDMNLIIPIGMFFLQIGYSFLYEKIRIMKGIDKNNGILTKPFENMKKPNESISLLITGVITSLALRGNLSILTVLMVLIGTFTNVFFTRSITMHIYAIYFAKKYGFEKELFMYND